MKAILIDDEIGFYGITAQNIRKEFESVAEGEEIKLVIDSPGGDCFEGISIYNYIRNFARTHINEITTYVQGMAASAASWIACAANSINPNNKIIVEDNSVFMIHNSQSVAIGDYREMKKTGDFCKRIDQVIKEMLSNRCKKDIKDVAKLMDEETWYFGNEIIENGFADESYSLGDIVAINKADAIINAQTNYTMSQKKLRDFVESNKNEYKDSVNRSIQAFNIFEKVDTTLESSNKIEIENKEKKDMTKAEFMSSNKALFDEITNEATENSVKIERERVANLLEKFEKAGNVANALQFIKEGKSLSDNEVIDSLLETSMKAKEIENRIEDEPPAFVPAPKVEVEDEATKEFNAVFGL